MGHEAGELPRVGKPAIAPHFHTAGLMIVEEIRQDPGVSPLSS